MYHERVMSVIVMWCDEMWCMLCVVCDLISSSAYLLRFFLSSLFQGLFSLVTIIDMAYILCMYGGNIHCQCKCFATMCCCISCHVMSCNCAQRSRICLHVHFDRFSSLDKFRNGDNLMWNVRRWSKHMCWCWNMRVMSCLLHAYSCVLVFSTHCIQCWYTINISNMGIDTICIDGSHWYDDDDVTISCHVMSYDMIWYGMLRWIAHWRDVRWCDDMTWSWCTHDDLFMYVSVCIHIYILIGGVFGALFTRCKWTWDVNMCCTRCASVWDTITWDLRWYYMRWSWDEMRCDEIRMHTKRVLCSLLSSCYSSSSFSSSVFQSMFVWTSFVYNISIRSDGVV